MILSEILYLVVGVNWYIVPKINLEFFNLDAIHFYSKGIHKVNGQLELLFLENKVEFNFKNQNNVMLSGSSDLIRIAEIGPVKIDT